MGIYRLPDGNTIVAEQDFIDEVYPGATRLPDPLPDPKAAILAQLVEIDNQSNTPRARREAMLGNVTYLASLDKKAVTLRSQLEKLS